MSDNRKSLLQRMDGLVEWTGILRFARRERRVRRLKWMPIVAIVVATGGLVAAIGWSIQYLWVATTILALALNAAVIFQQVGPLRRKAESDGEDEREEVWRNRASGAAFTTVSIVAMIGIGSLGLWTMAAYLLRWSTVSGMKMGAALLVFAIYLFFLLMIVPTLYASWTLPDMIEDEPEEEGRPSFVKPRRR